MEFRIFEFNYKKSPEILRIQRCKILKNTMFMMCDCNFFSRLRGTTRNILTGTIYSVSRHRRTFNRLPRMVSYGNNLAYFLNSLQLTAWHSIMMQQITNRLSCCRYDFVDNITLTTSGELKTFLGFSMIDSWYNKRSINQSFLVTTIIFWLGKYTSLLTRKIWFF